MASVEGHKWAKRGGDMDLGRRFSFSETSAKVANRQTQLHEIRICMKKKKRETGRTSSRCLPVHVHGACVSGFTRGDVPFHAPVTRRFTPFHAPSCKALIPQVAAWLIPGKFSRWPGGAHLPSISHRPPRAARTVPGSYKRPALTRLTHADLAALSHGHMARVRPCMATSLHFLV